MRKRRRVSKRLVIDASIARASGGKGAVDPVSKLCRDFLEAVYRVCHRAVMTTAIQAEWNTHQSNYARSWRYWMMSRKKLEILNLTEDSALREKLIQALENPSRSETVLKDAHLVEASLATDLTICSRDEEVRALFNNASSRVIELRNIVWVNPTQEDEHALQWLRDGALDEPERKLGSRPS